MDRVINLYNDYNSWGVVLVSGKETRFYKVSVNSKQHLKTINVDLPNQHKKGGQSQARYERITEEKRMVYIQKLAEYLQTYYVLDGRKIVSGLILAGPSETKHLLGETSIVRQYFVGNPFITFIETSEITDTTLYDVLPKLEHLLDPINDPTEKKVIDEFYDLISRPHTIDKVIFGREEILALLETQELAQLLIDEQMNDFDVNQLLKSNNKITLIKIKNRSFIGKFGNLVGIKWY